MDLSYGSALEGARSRIRDFLIENWAPENRSGQELLRYTSAFRRRATEQGYLYRGVPRRYGGSEQPADLIRAQIIREEFGRARAPMEVPGNGTAMLVPTLVERGTEAQCARFIPPTLAGNYIWAQGYSEPGAGSDLASVRMRGELAGDHWILNGQKIWTTHGDRATHMFALVRTEPDAPKHAGISYLLVDLRQAGVTVRPIRQMTGGADFSEIFFDDVRTPDAWRVGERGEGWAVSRTTLRHERASIGSADALGGLFDKLVSLARATHRFGRPAIEDPEIRQSLARIEGWVLAHRASAHRLFSLAIAGEASGLLGLMAKLLATEIGQDIALLAQELIGDHALDAGTPGHGPAKWLGQIMGSLGSAIAGGTSNIQRNIIAERGLGLPRDPRAGDGAA